MAKFPPKNTILTKSVDGRVHALMVQTNSDMVYTGENKTLTETLEELESNNSNVDVELVNIGNKITQLTETMTKQNEELILRVHKLETKPNTVLTDNAEDKEVVDLVSGSVWFHLVDSDVINDPEDITKPN